MNDVERVARAMCRSFGYDPDDKRRFNETGRAQWTAWEDQAKVAVDALLYRTRIQEGPIETPCKHSWGAWGTYVELSYLERHCGKCFEHERKTAAEVPESVPRIMRYEPRLADCPYCLARSY